MKAWHCVVAVVALVAFFVAGAVEWHAGAQDRALKAKAKQDASAVADEVIRRAIVHYTVDDAVYGKGTAYEFCWSSSGADYLYKAIIRVNDDGRKFMILAAYELPRGDTECHYVSLQMLFEMLLGQLRVVREERFTDDDANGEPEAYVSYMRGDQKPFVTPRDRDIGERAGVRTERATNGAWRRYAAVLHDARGHLEQKKK